jgi:hypothetical protein
MLLWGWRVGLEHRWGGASAQPLRRTCARRGRLGAVRHLHVQAGNAAAQRVVGLVAGVALDLGAHALLAQAALQVPALALDGGDAVDGLHPGVCV